MATTKFRTIATFVQGSAIGVIEEPVIPGGVPKNRRGELWQVKVGMIDERVGRTGPFPAEVFDGVVRELRAFLRREGVR